MTAAIGSCTRTRGSSRICCKGFLDEPWVKDIEWSTLKLEESQHVSRSLKQRRNDLVWRMSLKGGRSLFVYLMLEFQATVDWHMAVRLLTYLGLFYEGLVRSGSPKRRKLPAVVPVVVYNGVSPWSAKLDVRELVEESSGAIAEYHPRLRYKLIEARSCGELDDSRENLSDVMFRLERAETEADARRAVALLQQWLEAGEHARLRQHFSQWITRAVLSARVPGTHVPEARELAEVMKVLDEEMVPWTERWKAEGMAEGIAKGVALGIAKGVALGKAEGKAEGVAQGRQEQLIRIVHSRFGEIVADSLAALLQPVSSEQVLDELTDWVASCRSGEDLLARVRHG